MKTFRNHGFSLSLFMIMMMLFIAGPYTKAQASVISTQTMVQSSKADNARAEINSLLARQDIQDQLTAMGISPDEAKLRAASLSDSEAVSFADQMQNAPAGGDGLGLIVGTALFVFLVLLITDILGFTKVFKFTRAVR